MEQDAGALDMAEEAVADAGAFGRALDQAGNVGEDEVAALVADDAELRVERGERIIADLGLGVGDGVEEGRLAGIGQADQAASAISLRRSQTHISSPGQPVPCWRGARLVEVL